MSTVEPIHPERPGQSYASAVGGYDEMCDAQGHLRPSWRPVLQALQKLGGAGLLQRRLEARRLLRESGVTYNVYNDPKGLNRPWELDPIPYLIDSEEWRGIEQGLRQRAELLNRILADLYGARDLVRLGLIPPQVVYGHPGFLRACDQVGQDGHHQLVLYAADLARAPDGQFWVLGDRTQAPSGVGYALENRTVMNRVMPGLFRETHVHRLALFFRALRSSLIEAAPDRDEPPRIVVLTPGPMNETYFEHSYLANYLGFTLVQGADLTVRNGRVWMKSLGGLEPVDVILRRVDDDWCDPMELRGDSQLGVAGLLDVARRGNVVIANPMGSSVLENPALMPFLPKIAQYFLGEDLRMPSVSSWWCGEAQSLEYVLDNLSELVVKPIARQWGEAWVYANSMNQADLDELRVRIKANPNDWVAQARLQPSTVPSLVEQEILPRPAVLRSFLVAREDNYVLMPGGLTRIATDPNDPVVSNQSGAISKDTWILATEAEQQLNLHLRPSRSERIDLDSLLPSRAAENLFWVGRYAERAESTIRLLRAILITMDEAEEYQDSDHIGALRCLLAAITELTMTQPGFVGEGSEERLADPEMELTSLILDPSRVGSLMGSLHSMVNAAYGVRDLMSNDTWRVIDDIQEELAGMHERPPIGLADSQDELDRLITALAAFSGLSMESMTREHGWLFLDIGRRLERSMSLVTLLRTVLTPAYPETLEYLLLESLLASTETQITHRRRYRAQMHLETVLDLLLFDLTNPRSLIFQLDRLQQDMQALPGKKLAHHLSEEERSILAASSSLQLSRPKSLCLIEDSRRPTLDSLLGNIRGFLMRASDDLNARFFTHAPSPHQLMPIRRQGRGGS